ncbi:uncharacterized protein [Oryza sativa Japonica Group]|uniref:Os04g0502100 protein n=4 Tax=Oryza TaxID=4527 RepID=Q0JBZ0_ORYSJ|nr:uncharacterized protein LOC4336315 [Oryza sativa Japonica Group]XP_052151512.1 uncharacterized protein LOC127769894 [Oryza glaberrima]XP_052151513.1 uncharacterized protein LOC127769894 [Oryza glaberrima]KAB8095978.1 hypothetical protein EE612_024237 [Oryza sativa]KAF2934782.1 hypothetical protein DAI22_04g187800 [Oryza sativa Japonica Group]BAF15147.1 Os04g0502100 [Oryza sativa Japonica Group]BAG90198.1 unnamed protein product [Oryza sativa Japonica Group]BAS89944.1 Os04g0502100 [Oryza s|eukprot:NP_001053233.1 Os04g0502100 [Oryza sativa Japonica Group]
MDQGSSSSMSSCSSSTTASTGPDQRRLSAAAPTFDPSMASSSSMAATTAGVPGSSPAMAPLLTSARMSSGSSASSTTSFDPAGSSALAPARSPRPGLSASAPAFYPTTASSSSTPVMPAVPGFLPQIPEPTASCSDFPPEMLWHHPCGEQKIKGGRPDLLGREFGILAEQKRLIQRHLDLKEEMHLRHNKEIENAFISETRLARGVEQDLLGDCKKAVLVQQDQSGKEEESHQCLRQLQDVNGEQLVGVPKLGLPGAEENVACNNTASHKEFSEFPGPDIKFGSINIRDIPLLQGRQAAVILPNPQLDRRTSGLTPAGASSLDQETDQELNEKLL